ncbi:MAG: hypothetical protein HQK57_02670 [Deltaproteobacteria bacterium]|nr:hypothetical protein [Deltaproteobacteria bacterium]
MREVIDSFKPGRITSSTSNISGMCIQSDDKPEITPGKCVQLKIQDTGGGMAAETLSRVFEPFFTTKFQGRGMGLAAAYGIIRNHGGYILAESQEGRGATFTIHLPATAD